MIRQVGYPADGPNLVTCSPDGEPRGLTFRAGDVFPLLPFRQLCVAPDSLASAGRPWGLRFLTVPPVRAGKHEGATKQTSNNPDGNSPEEISSD
jgi:hypothetical protein